MRQDELERIEKVKQGLAVVANKRSDHGLIAWAEKEGLATKVDRSSKYGNPSSMEKQEGRRGNKMLPQLSDIGITNEKSLRALDR